MSCDEPDCCTTEFRIENGRAVRRVATLIMIGADRCATKNAHDRSSLVHSEPDGPEAVQITGPRRFRQPRFVDITYTRGYIWWFLRERVFER